MAVFHSAIGGIQNDFIGLLHGVLFRLQLQAGVVQKDVNNYLIVPEGPLFDEKGKPRWKCKGAYVKKLSDLDYEIFSVVVVGEYRA